MQLYTKAYDPSFWAEQGSLPVAFSSEMFVNLGHLGLVPFALVWLLLNRGFVGIYRAEPHSFSYHSRVFLAVTTLLFARGSGIELYLLTYLFALPIFCMDAVLRAWWRPTHSLATA
jgi:hypothetical protein